jgi:light-regulated signal transduction histidine kinase (bacteriophytochrome)
MEMRTIDVDIALVFVFSSNHKGYGHCLVRKNKHENKKKHVGLGLFITKSIVELHEGKISIDD